MLHRLGIQVCCVASVAIALALAIMAGSAHAAFPGGNGEISVATAHTTLFGEVFERKQIAFDSTTGEFKRFVTYPQSGVRTRLSYAPNGATFVASGGAQSVRVGDAESMLSTSTLFTSTGDGGWHSPTTFVADGRAVWAEWYSTMSAQALRIYSQAPGQGAGPAQHGTFSYGTNDSSSWSLPKYIVGSPVGNVVYLDNSHEDGPRGIWRLDLDTNQRTRIDTMPNVGHPGYPHNEFRIHDISPDGRYLLFGYETSHPGFTRTQLAYYDTFTSTRHEIRDTAAPLVGGGSAIIQSMVFSPDGTKVAYVQRVGSNTNQIRVRDVAIDEDADDELYFTNDRPLDSTSPLEFPVEPNTATLSWRTNTARFDVTPVIANPAAFTFTNQTKNESGDDMLVREWNFGDGTPTVHTHNSIVHSYAKPGTYTATLTVEDPDNLGRTYTASKVVKVRAPELQLSLVWDTAEVEVDGRLPVDTTFPAELRIKATSDGVGPITDITFDDDTMLEWEPQELLEATAEEFDGEPFSLQPGATRTIDVMITPREAGRLTFTSAITGRDSSTARRPVKDDLSKPVRIGHDFTLGIETKVKNEQGSFVEIPVEGIELEVEPGEEDPTPRDIRINVAVKNVSGADAEEVKLDLREILRSPRDGAPAYTEHGIELLKYRVVGSPNYPAWTTILPAQAQWAIDLPIGSGDELLLAEGATATVEFEGHALRQSVLDVRGIARGVDRTGDTPQLRSGFGFKTMRIDQDVLLVVEKTAGDFDPQTRAGDIWYADVRVKNISQDTTINMLAMMKRSGNIVGRRIGELGGQKIDSPGMVAELAPGESIMVQAEFSSEPDGGTRGYLELPIGGWVLEDADGEYLALEDQRQLDPMEVVSRERADGTPVNFFVKHVDTSNPKPVEFASYSDAAWVFTDGFMRGFSKWAEGSIQTGRAITTHALKADVYAWQLIATVNQHLDPAVRERSRQEVIQLVQQLRNVSYADAKARVDLEAQKMFTPTLDAYYAADWRKLTHESAKMLGEQGTGKAVEFFVPQLLAARYVKYGGKTAVLAAQEAQDASFLTRINNFGRKGYKPGDRVNWQHATDLWGIDRLTDARLIEYAQKKRIMIAVRDRSPGSKQRLLEGALPKIEKIKAKNVNDIDVQYLGFSPGHKDLAMIKRMPNEHSMQATLNSISDVELRAKVKARYEQRAKEYEELLPEFQGYQQQGHVPVPSREFGMNPNSNSGGITFDGVWDKRAFELPSAGTNGIPNTTDGLPAFQPRMAAKPGDTTMKPFTGDMDPIAFLDESGEILSLERRMEVYEELAELGMQHPESLTWDNAAGRANYLNDFDMANEGAEALLAYTPDGTRRAVMFDSRKSRWEANADPNSKALMFMNGVDRVKKAQEVAGRVRNFVKIILPPQQPYYTPGSATKYADGEGIPLLRKNADGTYDAWNPNSGWSRYVPKPGEQVESTPQTGLTRDVAAGENYLQIIEQAALRLGGAGSWFKPGDQIVINPGGATQETTTVAKLGSIYTTAALKYAHAPGEIIGVVPRAATTKATITPVKGIAPVSAARVAVVANVTCPAQVGACVVTAPKRAAHKIGAKRHTAVVSAPASIAAGRSAQVTVKLTAAAVKQLTRRTTPIAVAVTATNRAGAATSTIRATVAKPKAAVRVATAVLRVKKSGRAVVGSIVCPAGAGTCTVKAPARVTLRVRGTRVVVTLQAPRTVRAGKTVPIRMVFPKASWKRLGTTNATGVALTASFRLSNEGGVATSALRVRLRR